MYPGGKIQGLSNKAYITVWISGGSCTYLIKSNINCGRSLACSTTLHSMYAQGLDEEKLGRMYISQCVPGNDLGRRVLMLSISAQFSPCGSRPWFQLRYQNKKADSVSEECNRQKIRLCGSDLEPRPSLQVHAP